jgi:hypothetical protein
MRRLNERKIVVVLFALVIVLFSFAQNDTTALEKEYLGNAKKAVASLVTVAANAGQQP